ncbi:MAG TPA: hypothetical protein VFN09_06145 [Rhodanobacteraceae bacterium]|nr:hypothetical protein [Rhodanobacteraceae bacterium]
MHVFRPLGPSLLIALLALPWALPAPARATATLAADTVIDGQLEMAWADRAPFLVAGPSSRFAVRLITHDGRTLPLEPQAALRAAGNLYALFGQHVGVAFDPTAQTAAVGSPLTSEAIVPFTAPAANQATGVNGSQPWVTLMCKFAGNSSEPKSKAYFSAMYGTAAGELGDYWQQVSYGKINIAGSTAYGWASLPHPRSYYITGSGSSQSANLDQLFADCTAAFDAVVDFSQFVGVALVFNGDLDGYAWGGNRYASLDGQYKSWRVTWQPPWSYQNLAPSAHEMGHGFGLPHANNSDQDSDPYDNPWDVMSDSWSNAIHSATYGSLPKHISIWSRDALGWIDASDKQVLADNGIWRGIHLSFAELGNPAGYREIRIQPPGAPASRYFTLEARQKAGDYDGNLAATAVIVHAVDTNRQEPAWSVDRRMPPADTANNRESLFLVGDRYDLAPDVHLSVTAQVSDGFLLDVQIGDIPEVIFRGGFEL